MLKQTISVNDYMAGYMIVMDFVDATHSVRPVSSGQVHPVGRDIKLLYSHDLYLVIFADAISLS